MGAFKEPHGGELKDLYLTVEISPDLAAHRILVKLEGMGFTR